MKNIIVKIAMVVFLFTTPMILKSQDPKIKNVNRSLVSKMSDASANIVFDEPKTDIEASKPNGYKTPNQLGVVVQVSRNTYYRTRGGNKNIKFDVPSIDVEQPKN